MRIAIVAAVLCLASARPSEACVQFAETNRLLGWSADGTLAVHVRSLSDGKLGHAEILPTRYEGWKYVIGEESGEITIKKIAIDSCKVGWNAPPSERVKGPLTEDTLRALPLVAGLKLVAPPADDDGGAKALTAKFVPQKRHAEHEVEVRDRKRAVVATLPVPVWCMGSCLRDEAWRSWGATVTQVATAGTRTLYVVRMRRVCNGGNDKDLWMERVIAAPGDEARPPRTRCRGSGT